MNRISATFRNRLILTAFVVVLLPAQVWSAVTYVDRNAAPGGDGSSWATAFRSIDAALPQNNPYDLESEVWIRQGTYAISAPLHVTGSIRIYGGFQGTETSLSQRHPTKYPTVIKGGTISRGIVQDQSGTELTADGLSFMHCNDGALVKESLGGRLTVRNCRFIDNGGGSALVIREADEYLVAGCEFRGNRAVMDGGAILVDDQSNGTIDRCTFRGNSADGYGGAISGYYLQVYDSIFLGNRAEIDGGAISLERGHAQVFVNCLFRDNYAGQYGGGVYVPFVAVGYFTNCTFAGNRAEMAGGAVYGDSYGFDGIIVNVANSILWQNLPDQVGQDFDGIASVTYSDVTGGFGGTGNIDANPLFASPSLQLAGGSPCVNAGTASAPYLPATDYTGNPRIAGSAPDMGYTEFPVRRGPAHAENYGMKSKVKGG